MPTVDDYLKLITPNHAQRPDFVAVVRLVTETISLAQAAALAVPAAFDLDTAAGVQLDAVGKWVGHDRNVKEPLPDVYFSWDMEGLGWDQGVWLGPYDPLEGIVSLDDDHFRLMLRARIASNHWDGTFEDAARILQYIILDPGDIDPYLRSTDFEILYTESGLPILIETPALLECLLFIQDGFDMTATIALAGKLPTALTIALLLAGYIDLRSVGVRLDYMVTSVDLTPLFGFDTENKYISGFDDGAWGVNAVPEH